MNYRHAYHAGNFADVLKHAVLALIVEHLKQKPSPFRVIDTHAGIGLYDLSAEAPQKTGEWRDGIRRVMAGGALPEEAMQLLAPYLSVIRAFNPAGGIASYPGSPLVARRLMRPDDQLIANELHPDDHAALRRVLASEPASKALALDGYTALKAMLPPKERRGLVLVDPPFEQTDELDRLVSAASDMKRRFATGVMMIWYPIKDQRVISTFLSRLSGVGFPKALTVEMLIRAPRRSDVLNGCGLAIMNPPFTLQGQLATLLPPLAKLLAQEPGGGFRLESNGA